MGVYTGKQIIKRELVMLIFSHKTTTELINNLFFLFRLLFLLVAEVGHDLDRRNRGSNKTLASGTREREG